MTENMDPIKKKSFFKVICNRRENEKVVGMHYLGPNAGEIMQGYAVAFKMGLKMQDLRNTVGIHPTISEEFVSLKITKDSGLSPEKSSC